MCLYNVCRCLYMCVVLQADCSRHLGNQATGTFTPSMLLSSLILRKEGRVYSANVTQRYQWQEENVGGALQLKGLGYAKKKQRGSYQVSFIEIRCVWLNIYKLSLTSYEINLWHTALANIWLEIDTLTFGWSRSSMWLELACNISRYLT